MLEEVKIANRYKVSVIMPAYNASKTIAESIESVINQIYKNWELIVINDCSTDNTQEIIEIYAKKNTQVKLITLTQNKGLPNARNIGVEKATGNFIAFLDSDDIWLNKKLKIQIDYHKNYPDCAISHTAFTVFDTLHYSQQSASRIWKIFTEKQSKQGNLLPILYYKNVIGVLTVLMKKNIFDELKGFDAKLWTFEDQDLWIRVAESGYKFGYINKVLAAYRVSQGSISNTIGRYKKAYKVILKKYANKLSSNKAVLNLAWGYYYRYFGTVYFKKKKHRLANLYFLHSLKLHGFSFISITTILYMAYNRIKQEDSK